MEKPVKWSAKVEHLMACNCNFGCPCSFDAPPTYGTCEAATVNRVVKGSYAGVKLDGLKFGMRALALLASGLLTKKEEFFAARTFWVKTDGLEFAYPGRNGLAYTTVWRGP